jgi:hypothetical protein
MLVLVKVTVLTCSEKPICGGMMPVTPVLLLKSAASSAYVNLQSNSCSSTSSRYFSTIQQHLVAFLFKVMQGNGDTAVRQLATPRLCMHGPARTSAGCAGSEVQVEQQLGTHCMA